MSNDDEKNGSTTIPFSTLLSGLSYFLAIIAIFIGLSAVFNVQYVSKEHDKALLWFGYALIAILFPYIKEITFKDLKVVIADIKEASEKIEGAAITAKDLAYNLSDTKNELINGYQELLRLLPEEQRKERVRRLSALYLKELGVTVLSVKKWLVDIGKPIRNLNDEMDDDYLSVLREFQKENNLGDDGIFGYRTLNVLLRVRKKE
jgi:hypothetical protein